MWPAFYQNWHQNTVPTSTIYKLTYKKIMNKKVHEKVIVSIPDKILLLVRKIIKINCRGCYLPFVSNASLGPFLVDLLIWTNSSNIPLSLVFILVTILPYFTQDVPCWLEHFLVVILAIIWVAYPSNLKNRITWLCHIWTGNGQEALQELKATSASVPLQF